MRRRTWITIAPVLAMLAVGCAAQPAATLAPAPTTSPTVAPSTPTTTTTTANQPTDMPTIAAPAASAPTVAAPTLGLFEGVPHGVTPEGFYFLGQPNAPVTMTDYSDFL